MVARERLPVGREYVRVGGVGRAFRGAAVGARERLSGRELARLSYEVVLPGEIEPQRFYPHLVTTCSIPKLRTATERRVRVPRRLHTAAQCAKGYTPTVDTGAAWDTAKQQAADSTWGQRFHME